MKYILMMSGTKADFDWYAKWSRQVLAGAHRFHARFQQELKDSGKFVSRRRSGLPARGQIVRAGNGGEPVTDGVFPEAKEFLAGYFIVEVESPDEAYRLAARISAGARPRQHQGESTHRGAASDGRPSERISVSDVEKGK